jgi:hypothetical protein
MAELSDGHALHAVMVKFRDSGADTLLNAWNVALQSEDTALDLYRRHAVVVGLLRNVTDQVDILPSPARNRLWRYVPQWWEIVLAPTVQWHATTSVAAHADLNSLDHLGSAADILAHNLSGTSMALRSADLADLLDKVSIWRTDLRDGQFEDIPKALRLSLIQGLEHIIWLINNSNVFGAARAVQAAEEMTGKLAVATAHLKTAEILKAWRERLVALGAALVFLTGSLNIGTNAINSSIEFGASVNKVIHAINIDGDSQIMAPKAITSGSPPESERLALTQGDQGGADGEGESTDDG